MQIIQPSHQILYLPSADDVLGIIELAGRTCYKSEEKIAQGTAQEFIQRILRLGHESVIEHGFCSVRIICDRGVSHELVRHRLAAYSQESTRYANYSKQKFGREITVIKPSFWQEGSPEYQEWLTAMQQAENSYLNLLDMGATPQEARSVLPNSLKTEIVMTCNMREWRHVFKLRCSKRAHPQIREIMLGLLADMKNNVPVLFDDIFDLYKDDMT